jgi:hypothetical protein
VAVTAAGALQLTIQQVANNLACGEVFLDCSLGLGDYIFTLRQQSQQHLKQQQKLQKQPHRQRQQNTSVTAAQDRVWSSIVAGTAAGL